MVGSEAQVREQLFEVVVFALQLLEGLFEIGVAGNSALSDGILALAVFPLDAGTTVGAGAIALTRPLARVNNEGLRDVRCMIWW